MIFGISSNSFGTLHFVLLPVFESVQEDFIWIPARMCWNWNKISIYVFKCFVPAAILAKIVQNCVEWTILYFLLQDNIKRANICFRFQNWKIIYFVTSPSKFNFHFHIVTKQQNKPRQRKTKWKCVLIFDKYFRARTLQDPVRGIVQAAPAELRQYPGVTIWERHSPGSDQRDSETQQWW